MVELTDFLRNLTTTSLQTLATQAAEAPQTITSQQISEQVAASTSFQQAATIFQNILSGGELPETFRESVTTLNLLGLGEASLDISGALSEEVAVRERQRIEITDAIKRQEVFTTQVNERLSQQVTQLGESLKTGAGGFDPIKFFTENPLFLGLSVGGLAVGAVVLLLVLRK